MIGPITELKYNDISTTLSALGFYSEVTEGHGADADDWRHRARLPAISSSQSPSSILRFPKCRASSATRSATASRATTFDASQSDFDFYGTLSFGRHVAAQGGYRLLTADYLVDQDAGDLKMKGWAFRRARALLKGPWSLVLVLGLVLCPGPHELRTKHQERT